MAFDFDKLIQKGTEMADAVKSTAVDLAEKGKKQVDLVSEQAKLAKAQRQRGEPASGGKVHPGNF